MKAIINKLKSIFISSESKSMFDHDADGEPCAFCKKPMKTTHTIIKVGSGEKMHNDCWGDFFRSRTSEISNRYNTD